MFLYPEDIDEKLNWSLGRAARLAKKKRLPHILLPDGSIRFEWKSIEKLLRYIEPEELSK